MGLFFLQLKVIATRSENSIMQTATANVTITVTRNQFPPVFTENVYGGLIIDEKDPLPVNITRVLAIDGDGVSKSRSFLCFNIYNTSYN